jgi:hypothetical protein
VCAVFFSNAILFQNFIFVLLLHRTPLRCARLRQNGTVTFSLLPGFSLRSVWDESQTYPVCASAPSETYWATISHPANAGLVSLVGTQHSVIRVFGRPGAADKNEQIAKGRKAYL